MNKWIKLLIVVLTFAICSTCIYLILKAFNLTDISIIKELINSSGQFSYIVYTIVLIIVLVVLCFIPLLNTALVIIGIALFGPKIAFISNMISIFFSTSILFFIGDVLGEKFARKLIGKKTLEETQNSIDLRSKFWLPILFITPGIPDEAICLVAGMTKMKYWYLLLVSLIYHSLEIGLFCFFGSSLIDWSSLKLIDWIIVSNLIIVDIYLLTRLEKYFENLKNCKK